MPSCTSRCFSLAISALTGVDDDDDDDDDDVAWVPAWRTVLKAAWRTVAPQSQAKPLPLWAKKKQKTTTTLPAPQLPRPGLLLLLLLPGAQERRFIVVSGCWGVGVGWLVPGEGENWLAGTA